MANKTQLTEQLNAPEVQVPVAVQQHYTPPQKRLERQGSSSAPMVHHMPEIRGGICEWCGVMDPNVASQYQYQLCPHFRGLGEMRCSYCPETSDPTEVARRSVLHITDSPNDPSTLIAVCNSYECSRKHLERFRISQ